MCHDDLMKTPTDRPSAQQYRKNQKPKHVLFVSFPLISFPFFWGKGFFCLGGWPNDERDAAPRQKTKTIKTAPLCNDGKDQEEKNRNWSQEEGEEEER
jgi:hypothetical protein